MYCICTLCVYKIRTLHTDFKVCLFHFSHFMLNHKIKVFFGGGRDARVDFRVNLKLKSHRLIHDVHTSTRKCLPHVYTIHTSTSGTQILGRITIYILLTICLASAVVWTIFIFLLHKCGENARVHISSFMWRTHQSRQKAEMSVVRMDDDDGDGNSSSTRC